MSYWTRIRNALRPARVEQEIAAEIESHLEEAREAGREQALFGNELHHREASRDAKVAQWLDSLRADTVFAWRQLTKRKTATAIAVLSLAIGIGSVLSAYRLLDAGFLRTLPVRDADRLHFLRYSMAGTGGAQTARDSFSYDEFQAMRVAMKGDAELLMVSFADRQDITFAGPAEVERVSRQYISGAAFSDFGLAPIVGRLFGSEQDDPGIDHRIAVVTHDYALRRFPNPADAIGKTFRYLGGAYTIIGVIEPKFTGTATGAVIDVFLPLLAATDATSGDRTGSRFARILVHLNEGIAPEQAREKLRAAFQTERESYAKKRGMYATKALGDAYVNARLALLPASGGISNFQRDYRIPITILIAIASAVLLLCCTSVASLLTIRSEERARELALRISIGAGRRRLIRMLLVESVMLGMAASAVGMLFAWWSAPFVVSRLNPPGNPLKLQLAMDARVAAAGVMLALGVTLLFGLLPALRASGVHPAEALKEGAANITRGRLARGMIAAQAAFCVLVCFVAGLLADSLRRLDSLELGFSPARLLWLETSATSGAEPAETWRQLRTGVEALSGVESVGLCGWAVQTGAVDLGRVQVGDRPVEPLGPYFYHVASGWFGVMGIPLAEGRDFRPGESGPAVIVNQQFVRHYFDGRSAVGETFLAFDQRVEIVGVARDIRMRELREAPRPAVFFPHGGDRFGALAIRLAPGTNPAALGGPLRRLVADGFPQLRIEEIRMQEDLIEGQTVRERLLAALAGFFGAVALLLAGMGLYGVLSHGVSRRSREIAIRMAMGAQARSVAMRVLRESGPAPLVGAALGLAAGRGVEAWLRSFLFEVSGWDVAVLGPVLLALIASGSAASVIPVMRAVRTDPARALRAD